MGAFMSTAESINKESIKKDVVKNIALYNKLKLDNTKIMESININNTDIEKIEKSLIENNIELDEINNTMQIHNVINDDIIELYSKELDELISKFITKCDTLNSIFDKKINDNENTDKIKTKTEYVNGIYYLYDEINTGGIAIKELSNKLEEESDKINLLYIRKENTINNISDISEQLKNIEEKINNLKMNYKKNVVILQQLNGNIRNNIAQHGLQDLFDLNELKN